MALLHIAAVNYSISVIDGYSVKHRTGGRGCRRLHVSSQLTAPSWLRLRILSSCFCFFQDELTDNQELIQTYRLHIAQDINQDNLALFCGSYQ